jgi:DNA-binding transcriptional LysR family regulator
MAPSRIRRYLRHGRLSQLAVFEASARLGCYTRAARELHLAQPTVSTQIRKLSDALGLALFEQVGKRMYPTEAGRCLQAACVEVLGTLGRLEETLARLRSLDTGRLSLGAGTCGARIASQLIARFAREHPRLEVALHICNRQSLMERMARDEDDLYLFVNPPRDGVVSQRIAPHVLGVVGAEGHPFAARRMTSFASFAAEPLVMRERGSGTRQRVEEMFRKEGVEPRIRLELASNDAVEEAVRAGAGLAVLPITPDLAARGLVPLEVEGFPLEGALSLVYPLGKAPASAAHAFLEFARRETN